MDNALRLVLLLAKEGSLGVSDAARALGLAPSTTHRLLTTMRYRGFAVQSEDRTYRPGPAFADLVGSSVPPLDLAGATRPHLDALARALGETCHLVVRDGREVRFLVSVESSRELRVTSRAGATLPAHLTSGGKVLLAELSAPELERDYPRAGVPSLRLGPEDVARLVRELRSVRRRGYALNRGESERGIAAIGMLVRGLDGNGVAAVSLSVPTVRFSSARVQEMLPVLRKTLAAIDRDLSG